MPNCNNNYDNYLFDGNKLKCPLNSKIGSDTQVTCKNETISMCDSDLNCKYATFTPLNSNNLNGPGTVQMYDNKCIHNDLIYKYMINNANQNDRIPFQDAVSYSTQSSTYNKGSSGLLNDGYMIDLINYWQASGVI